MEGIRSRSTLVFVVVLCLGASSLAAQPAGPLLLQEPHDDSHPTFSSSPLPADSVEEDSAELEECPSPEPEPDRGSPAPNRDGSGSKSKVCGKNSKSPCRMNPTWKFALKNISRVFPF